MRYNAIMTRKYTEHSRKLLRQSARRSLDKALAEGRIKRKMLQAPAETIDAFVTHMDATGGKTIAEKLDRINKILDETGTAKRD